MRTLVIGNCSSRKRLANSLPVKARDIHVGSVEEVAHSWVEALNREPQRVPVAELYCGRAFMETMKTARQLNADLLVISAGLGLTKGSTPAPLYDATVSGSGADNVLKKITPADASSWWSWLNTISPFAVPLSTDSYDLVLIALSGPYLKMFLPSLAGLPGDELQKVRLFSGSPTSAFPPEIRDLRMPYDARFDHRDGPLRGTKTDFAQRAMHHFAATVLSRHGLQVGLETHRQEVERALAGLTIPITPERKKLSDRAIADVIREHWAATDGRSTKMLRHLRDTLGVACEQKRFQKLFSEVKKSIKGHPA